MTELDRYRERLTQGIKDAREELRLLGITPENAFESFVALYARDCDGEAIHCSDIEAFDCAEELLEGII